MKKEILEEYLKQEVKEKRQFYLSDDNPIYRLDRKLEAKLIDLKKSLLSAKEINEKTLILKYSEMIKQLKHEKRKTKKAKEDATNTISKIEYIIDKIVNNYDRKLTAEKLYKEVEAHEQDIEHLGIEINRTTSDYEAGVEIYLKNVMHCLIELAEYSKTLHGLNTDDLRRENMNEIDIALSKQPFERINKSLI